MATQIPALTPIDPFPTRALPQDRFDTTVKNNMDQLEQMIDELNTYFITSVNAISNQTAADATTCTQKASAAATSATNAANSASTASTKASQAANSATAANQAKEAALAAQQAAEAADQHASTLVDITIATTSKAGLVKPDNSTITVDGNGVIAAIAAPWSGITGKPSSYTPSSHPHGNITNAGAIGSTASLPIITGTNGVLQTGSFGNSAGTFCQGNDARLSNTRNTTNSLVLKLKSGSTEGTDLYTFNGSAAKTLDIKQGSNITLTAAAGSLTIAAKDTTYTFTNKAATLAWGSTSTIATVGGTDITVTMPANPNTNTDTLMTQNVSTGNATYPILLCPTANATANQGAKTGIFGSGVKVNPSTSEVTATKFLGALQADKGTGSYVDSIKLGAGLINGSHTQFGALWNAPVKEYRVACATYPNNDNKIYWYSITNTNVTNSTNTTSKIMTWDGGTGVLSATGFSGPLTGNVTGNCSGSSGSCTGNAATATAQRSTATDGNYSDVVSVANTGSNTNRVGTIRITNNNGSNTILLGVHNESNGAPAGLSITNTNGTLTATFSGTATISKVIGALQGNADTATTAGNVTGTVAIANGGTGATTRLNAIKALVNENVSTNATHFLGLKSDWSKVGYLAVSEVKTVLGLGSAAYTNSNAYAAASHTHSYLPLSGGTLTGTHYINSAQIRVSSDDKEIQLYGCTTGNYYPSLKIHGVNDSTTVNGTSKKGVIEILAGDSSADSSTYICGDGIETNKKVTIINENLSVDTFHAITIKNKAIDIPGTPTNNQYSQIRFLDSSDYMFGRVGSLLSNNGYNSTGLWSKTNISGTSTEKFLAITMYPTTQTSTSGSNTVSYTSAVRTNAAVIIPVSNNATSLGIPTLLWKNVYSGTSVIVISDKREKSDMGNIPDALLDVWGNIDFKLFKYYSSIEEKDSLARSHTGVYAQDIEDICNDANINPKDYGFFCYDEWQASPESVDENGNVIEEARSAGNRYGIRYEELLCVEAAYERREIARLKARLTAIENRLGIA